MDWIDVFGRFGWLWVALSNVLFLWLHWSLCKKFVEREEFFLKSEQLLQKAAETELELVRARGEINTLEAKIEGVKAVMGRQENQLTILLRGHLED